MSTVAGLKFACGCCSDGCICVTHCTTTPVALNGSLVRKLVVCRKHAMTSAPCIWDVSQYMPLPKDKRTKRSVWRYLVLATSAEEAVGFVHASNVHEQPEAYRASPCRPEAVLSWSGYVYERSDPIGEKDRVPVPARVAQPEDTAT